MKNFNQAFLTSVVLGSLVALAGCGASEPSEKEMVDAIQAYEPMQMLFGKSEKMMSEFKKVGCEKAGEKTFKCLIGSRDGKGMTMPFNFTRGDDGKWAMTPAQNG